MKYAKCIILSPCKMLLTSLSKHRGLRWPSGYRTCLSPLRPQVQVSVRTFSMRLEPSPHVKRVKVNALPKVVGFLRVLRFPPTGKVDRVG